MKNTSVTRKKNKSNKRPEMKYCCPHMAELMRPFTVTKIQITETKERIHLNLIGKEE